MKREMKEEEGDPQVKARIRQIAPRADAAEDARRGPEIDGRGNEPDSLRGRARYDPDRDDAPVVVAKAAGIFARQIAELARKNGVVVVERPPGRGRFIPAVKDGQSIPAGLFRAVAEVLAFVYKLRG